MFSFKRSLTALVGLLLLVGVLATLLPLIGQGQGKESAPFAQRRFYLTKTEHLGNQALSACAEGYHMASLWEIHDPTYLRYDTTLGYTKADSGFGPPSATIGWIRTGETDLHGPFPGSGNCLAWTSTVESGTVVSLSFVWDEPTGSRIDPWVAHASLCSVDQRVWCVQD